MDESAIGIGEHVRVVHTQPDVVEKVLGGDMTPQELVEIVIDQAMKSLRRRDVEIPDNLEATVRKEALSALRHHARKATPK